MRNLTILLPTRNEVQGLAVVVEMIPTTELKKMGWNHRLVLVDGYSTDGTVKVAQDLGMTVYDQRGGLGKGMGLRQAFKHYIESGDEALVMLDPDGTYDPRDIPHLLRRMDAGECDVVIGSRLRGEMDDGAMGRVNYLGNHILTWAAVALYRNFISDLCTGFWAFKREAIQAMHLNSISFEIEAEMYALAIIGVVTTVVSAFYYLRIIKVIYFDKPSKPFDESYDWGLKSSLILSSILILIYFIYPSILTSVVYSIIIY